MMMAPTFALQTLPAPAALSVLGAHVELQELSYGQMRRVLATAPSAGEAGETLLGACLLVDGVPLGLPALQALPGRFSGAIAQALQAVLALHGMSAPAGPEPPDEAPPVEDPPPDEPAEEPDAPEVLAPGEAMR